MWSQSRTTHDDLHRAHVWGCPVYILEPALQDVKKIPKWQLRAQLGMFVDFSQVHSSLAPLVLTTSTGKISPQYHVVFDDEFSTVPYMEKGTIPPHWNNLVKHSSEMATKEDFLIAETWLQSNHDTDLKPTDNQVVNPYAVVSDQHGSECESGKDTNQSNSLPELNSTTSSCVMADSREIVRQIRESVVGVHRPILPPPLLRCHQY